MPVQLNHTIVHAKDRVASAQFYSDILGLPKPITMAAAASTGAIFLATILRSSRGLMAQEAEVSDAIR